MNYCASFGFIKAVSLAAIPGDIMLGIAGEVKKKANKKFVNGES
jgi:hypothetical protein